MRAEFLALRVIHIVSAIMWVGSGLFTALFLIPSLAANRQITPQLMEGLQRRRTFIILPTLGLLAILSGVRMLWIDSAGFAESYMHTGTGRAFSVGGTAAILALLLQVLVTRPSGIKLGMLSAQLASAQSPGDRERLNVEIAQVRRRNAIATGANVFFGLTAAAAMAVARYV
jgi:uncharacterized membrane protein